MRLGRGSYDGPSLRPSQHVEFALTSCLEIQWANTNVRTPSVCIRLGRNSHDGPSLVKKTGTEPCGSVPKSLSQTN